MVRLKKHTQSLVLYPKFNICSKHGTQCELQRERLNPGLQEPQSVPVQSSVPCASDPFGMLKLISTLESSGWQKSKALLEQ